MYDKILQLLGADKIQHFLYGAVIGLLAAIPFANNGNPVAHTTAFAFVVGVAKEAVDLMSNRIKGRPAHGVEFLDIVATTLGGTYSGVVLFLAYK